MGRASTEGAGRVGTRRAGVALVLLLAVAAALAALRWHSSGGRLAWPEASTRTTAIGTLAPDSFRAPRPASRTRSRPSRTPQGRHAELAIAPLARPSAREMLERVRGADREAKLLHDAEQLAIAACMAERGFQYVPEPYDDEAQRDVAFGRVIAGDVEAARAVGYGLAESLEQRSSSRPSLNAEWVAQLDQRERTRWEEALAGPPLAEHDFEQTTTSDSVGVVQWDERTTLAWSRVSCSAQAQSEVHGDDLQHAAFEPQREALERAVRERVAKDPEYAAALERWRACMQEAGFRYERPGEPEQALRDEFAGGGLSQDQLRVRETELASIDARCTTGAELPSALQAATARAEPAVASEHEAELARLVAQQAASVASARDWLESEQD